MTGEPPLGNKATHVTFLTVLQTETRNRKISDEETDDILTLLDGNSPGFRTTLHAMLITFFMLLTMGFVYESCVTKVRDKILTSKLHYGMVYIIKKLLNEPIL